MNFEISFVLCKLNDNKAVDMKNDHSILVNMYIEVSDELMLLWKFFSVQHFHV